MPASTPASATSRLPVKRARRGRGRDVIRVARRSPLAAAGAVVVIVYALLAVAAPILTPHAPVTQFLEHRLDPPSRAFPLGLDQLGRDILSRILYGARLSLIIGLVVVVLGGVVGTAVGITAGFVGGRLNNVMMRITEA